MSRPDMECRLFYRREAAECELQLKIADGLPFLGLFFRKGTLMTTANVTGFSPVLETDALHGIEYLEFE